MISRSGVQRKNILTDSQVCRYKVNTLASQVGCIHEAEWLAQDIAGRHLWQVSNNHTSFHNIFIWARNEKIHVQIVEWRDQRWNVFHQFRFAFRSSSPHVHLPLVATYKKHYWIARKSYSIEKSLHCLWMNDILLIHIKDFINLLLSYKYS